MARVLRRCALCSRTYPEGRDFRTVSVGRHSYVYVCRNCAPRIHDIQVLVSSAKTRKQQVEERRRHHRRRTHLLLTFTHVRGNVVYLGVVKDISQGGMRFTSTARVSPGEQLNLDVFSPLTGLHIKAVGRVRWVEEREVRNDIGVEFTVEGRHMHLDDRRLYHRILAEFVLNCSIGGKQIEGRVKDISQGGLRFITSVPLPQGKRVDVSLESAGLQVVQAEGDFKISIDKTIVVVGVKKAEERYEIRARFIAPVTARVKAVKST